MTERVEAQEDLPAVEEDELSSLDLPAAPAHPLETRQIPLEQIAEIVNSRPEYYGIEALANNLHTQGQLEPALVRLTPAGAEHGLPYELTFGYRRKRAAELLGWTELRCEVRELTDDELHEGQISENFSREDLSPIAEANAMRRMMKMQSISQAEVARRLGCDPSHVSHRLKLLSLKESILNKVDAGSISASAAEAIASIPGEAAQQKVAELAERNDWGLKKVQKWVREHKAAVNNELVVQEAQELESKPELLVQTTDVVSLPTLVPRELSDLEVNRVMLYGLLRNGHDTEMLEYLAEELGYKYEQLWLYVSDLDEAQVWELTRRMALRFISAPHRFRTLEPELKAELGAGDGVPAALAEIGDGSETAEQEFEAAAADETGGDWTRDDG